MQTQNVEQIGYVYKRIKRGRRRKSFEFERMPAKKSIAPDGSVLLSPVPAASPANGRQSFVTVTLTEGVTVQLASEPEVQEQRPLRNDGSAQCSKLIIGTRKQACVGSRLRF